MAKLLEPRLAGLLILGLNTGFLASTGTALLGTRALGQMHTKNEAGAIQFQAQLDRDQVDLEESLNLRLSLQADAGSGTPSEPPTFDAPDFDILSQRRSSMIDSRYENGRFSVKNRIDFFYALRPKRAGVFQIRNVRIRMGGKDHVAANLSVTVVASGAATQPPRGYGGGGVGLRGAGKRTPGIEYFLRAETDRPEVYKGQQVIVSYYLYSRVNVNQPVVTKYPIMNGFLREDLEIPVIGGKLEPEQVVLDGVPYTRVLLARYAAYPLQEGKGRIDSMGVNLLVASADPGDPFGRLLDEDDPLGAGGILSQMLSRGLTGYRKGVAQSEIISIQVLPLPRDGRPPDYSGAVGVFEVTSAVDRTEIPRGVPFNVTFKIEGGGNLASVESPKLNLPEGFELYESKGKNKIGKKGLSERIVEYLVIPRKEGDFLLPPVQFSFFNPESRQYETRATQPMNIHVLPGVGSEEGLNTPVSRSQERGGNVATVPAADQIAPLKNADAPPLGSDFSPSRNISGPDHWVLNSLIRLLGVGAAVLGAAWVFLVARHLRAYRKAGGLNRQAEAARKLLARSKQWDVLGKQAEQGPAGLAWLEVLEFYERLSGALFDLLDRRFGITSRALSRSDLERELVSIQGLKPEVWSQCVEIFEYAEAVRFAVRAGVVTEQEARKKMSDWVGRGRDLEKALL